MKKCVILTILFSAVPLFACACSATSEPNDISICASTEETEDVFRIYTGDVKHAPDGYVEKRTEYLDSLVGTADSVDALVCFNDYYTVEEVTEMAEEYGATIDRAYMWPRGETGRLLLFAEDGDLDKSIDAYKLRIAEDTTCSDEMLTAYQSFMDDKYEVFAVVLTAPAKVLQDINLHSQCTSFIDVLYNKEAEEYAKQIGKPVSYIDAPAKPDGAL